MTIGSISLGDMLDVQACQDAIADRLISRRFLDNTDISVLNYTSRTTYRRIWTTETRRCRGLVVQGWGEDARVLARPFEKFFDLEDTSTPDHGSIVVSEKWDGSLGILYETDAGWRITTRGNPNSWQSKRATEIYQERYVDHHPPQGESWLFEIVLPQNKIVVDYKDMTDLVFIAAIDDHSGRDIGLSSSWPGTKAVRNIIDTKDLQPFLLEAEKLQNKEGFVLLWPTAHPQVRAKVKIRSYREAHHFIFSTSTRLIWEALASGHDIVSEAQERFGLVNEGNLLSWIRSQADMLHHAHQQILDEAGAAVDALQDDERAQRRLAAMRLKTSRYPGIAFCIYDQRFEQASAKAWQLVRPTPTTFYRYESEEEV